jgi:hypothetical protein
MGSIGFIGTTEVVPCYKARLELVFPQPVNPTRFIGFNGTTSQLGEKLDLSGRTQNRNASECPRNDS